VVDAFVLIDDILNLRSIMIIQHQDENRISDTDSCVRVV
jgi:hypothetical protein